MIPAVGTPGQGVVKSVEEEGVVTVSTGHPAHTRHVGERGRGRGGGGEVDDPLAVWSGAGDPLTGALADQQTVTGAPHVLPTRRGVPDGGGLVANWTLDDVLHKITVT